MSSIKQVKENINKKIKSGRSSRSTSSKGSNSSKSKSLFVQDFLEETDIKKIQRFLRSKLFIDKNTLDNRVKYLNYIQNNLKSIKENDCLEPGKLTDTFTVKNILNLEKLFSSKGTNSIIYKTSISKVFGNFPIATKVMKITEDNMNEIKIMEMVRDKIIIPKRSKHFPIMYKAIKCDKNISENHKLLSINELANGDLGGLIPNILEDTKLFFNIFAQTLIAIGSFHILTNHLHKDVHGGNFLWHNNNEKGYYEYVYNGKSFYVKACNYNIMIYDYSYATEITSKKEQISDYSEIIPTFLNESFSNSNSVSPPRETKDKLNSILDILMKKYTDTTDYDVFSYIIENILIPFNIVETRKPKKIIKTYRL